MNSELFTAFLETMIMLFIPTIVSIIFGLIIGSFLYLSHKNSIYPNKKIYNLLNLFVNSIRSIPFLIFVILLIPLTRYIFNTAFGVLPASFPICFVGIAIYSRFVEQSFYDVDKGIINLALSLNVNKYQLIYYFLIIETRQSLILGITSTMISIISYSTVMGIVGGGGLGDYIIRYGYYEYNYKLIYESMILIFITVFLIQYIGNKLANILDKKRGI